MKALIIEDEELAAIDLQSILKEIGGIEVVDVLESIKDTINWFRLNPFPELIFMDIHLADGSAFEIFKSIEITCPVIFTTGYDEYALKAFKVNSVDYLLKPVDRASVQKALGKLKTLSSAVIQLEIRNFLDHVSENKEYRTHFLVPQKGSKLVPLPVKDIFFITIESGQVKAFTSDGKTFMLENSLDDLGELLSPVDFFRANRQFIIGRQAIKDIDLWFHKRLSVNLKIAVPEKILISKARVTEFKNWFQSR